jgi:hypothetical protein
MEQYPIPENELERIRQLKSYELLGLGKDPDLDVFAQAACLITDYTTDTELCGDGTGYGRTTQYGVRIYHYE